MSDDIIQGKILDSIVYRYVGRLKVIDENYNRKDYLVSGVKLSGKGILEGQSFEKTEETTYNSVKYQLVYSKNGVIVDEIISEDGSFKFEGLNDKEQFSINVIDMSGKYIGKHKENIFPYTPYEESMDIQRIYQINSEALIKIKFNGDKERVAIFTSNANNTKIDDHHYKITDINGTYIVTLHDYVDDELYIKNKTY